ncbi:MAG: hypothetical protein RR135_01305 [Oscillospiraceae bacterium]
MKQREGFYENFMVEAEMAGLGPWRHGGLRPGLGRQPAKRGQRLCRHQTAAHLLRGNGPKGVLHQL